MNQPKTSLWKLDPAPESTDHVSLKSSYGLFIGGEFVESDGGGMFDTINPATEEKIAKITEATDADVDKAVKAARTAYQKVWSKTSPAAYLHPRSHWEQSALGTE